MSLLGKGALAMWHQVKPGLDAAHDDWHSTEHLSERLGLAGFRRGRRCRSIDGGKGWFILYEVDDLSVLSSPAYLERLNNPSEWSQKIIPSITQMNRTLARVMVSQGVGVGSVVATIRMTKEIDSQLVEAMADEEGVVGAHLLFGDRLASGIGTKEKTLRERADETSDWIVLIEGYDQELVSAATDRFLKVVGQNNSERGIYGIRHLVAEADV